MLACTTPGIPPVENAMSKHPVLARLTLSVALSLSAASLVAFASETTDIEVSIAGVTERVSIADLAIGETRQLYSEAGTLVTATRTAESLELDIGGDKTSIRMIEPGNLDEGEIATLLHAHGAEAKEGERRIVRIHRDKQAGDGAASVEGQRKIVVVKAGDGELTELDADAILLEHLGEPGAKQVVVKRRIERPTATDAN
jgi:hypothetical protein